MTSKRAANLYQPRHRLGLTELEWAKRRLAVVDAHHVAKVHERHGVISGFELSVDTEGALVVEGGEAYTPYGDLVVTDRRSIFPPPSVPGGHEVWLGHDGRVTLEPALDCQRPGAIRLGTAFALLVAGEHSSSIVWSDPPSERGRPTVSGRARAHVAAGTLALSLPQLDVSFDRQTITHRINTANGLFERTPLYFATFGAGPGPMPDIYQSRLQGWYVEICDPTPFEFTIRVRVRAYDSFFTDLTALTESPPAGPDRVQVAITISWLGVDPRRDEPHADVENCNDEPYFRRPDPILV